MDEKSPIWAPKGIKNEQNSSKIEVRERVHKKSAFTGGPICDFGVPAAAGAQSAPTPRVSKSHQNMIENRSTIGGNRDPRATQKIIVQKGAKREAKGAQRESKRAPKIDKNRQKVYLETSTCQVGAQMAIQVPSGCQKVFKNRQIPPTNQRF